MYNLLFWVREPYNESVTYTSDWGGYSITAHYSASDPLEFEYDVTKWELFDNAGYLIKSFSTLADAQNYAEYLYENRE